MMLGIPIKYPSNFMFVLLHSVVKDGNGLFN